jgi:uncharacterized OsmC-like protein
MSNDVTITYEGAMNAKFELPDSGTQAIGAPASCGGTGKGLSPKDLFVAGYASCVVMAMDVAAKKGGFDIAGAKITVSPVWAKNEPILEEINTMLVLPQQYDEGQLDVLRKGERYCPIHNSLRPEVKTTLMFEVGQ